MKESTQNRSRNRFQNQAGTRLGTTDQTQTQTQTVVSACSWFISGSDRIRNNGYLPSPSFGFGQGRTR